MDKVIVYDCGSAKLECVKLFKKFLGKNLAESKAIADEITEGKGPKSFTMHISEATEFAKALKELGVNVAIEKADGKVQSVITIEDLNEKIEALHKHIGDLEERIAKLENKPAGASSKNDNAVLRVVATHTASTLYAYRFNSSGKLEFDFDLYPWMGRPEYKKRLDSKLNEYSRWRESINNGDFSKGTEKTFIQPDIILELSDGNFYTISAIGSTLREVKAFATLIGYPIPDKAKTDTLAAAIVRERGVDGWCLSDGQAMKSTGTVYRYNKLTKQNIINMIKKASNSSSFIIEEPDVNGKSEGELVEAYINMFNTAKPRELPSKDEILRQFDEALRIEKLKLQE